MIAASWQRGKRNNCPSTILACWKIFFFSKNFLPKIQNLGAKILKTFMSKIKISTTHNLFCRNRAGSEKLKLLPLNVLTHQTCWTDRKTARLRLSTEFSSSAMADEWLIERHSKPLMPSRTSPSCRPAPHALLCRRSCNSTTTNYYSLVTEHHPSFV